MSRKNPDVFDAVLFSEEMEIFCNKCGTMVCHNLLCKANNWKIAYKLP